MRNYNDSPTQILERSGSRYITGHAAVFYDPKDSGTEYNLFLNAFERFERSAFDKLQDQLVECWYDHDPKMVLGSTANGSLRLTPDEKGLYYEQEINPADPDHIKVRAKIDSRLVGGSSIGFWVTRSSWETEGDKDIFLIHDCTIRDVGPCPMPRYKSAEAMLRSGDADLTKLKKQWETWRRIRFLDTI